MKATLKDLVPRRRTPTERYTMTKQRFYNAATLGVAFLAGLCLGVGAVLVWRAT